MKIPTNGWDESFICFLVHLFPKVLFNGCIKVDTLCFIQWMNIKYLRKVNHSITTDLWWRSKPLSTTKSISRPSVMHDYKVRCSKRINCFFPLAFHLHAISILCSRSFTFFITFLRFVAVFACTRISIRCKNNRILKILKWKDSLRFPANRNEL